MLLLIDAQLPAAPARWFEAKGFLAAHVSERGLAFTDDYEIWRHAASVGSDCVIVTKDEDFILLQAASAERVRVVWVRLGNCSNRDLIAAFDHAWPEIKSSLEGGTRIIEIVK